jgi:hypothetical protein
MLPYARGGDGDVRQGLADGLWHVHRRHVVERPDAHAQDMLGQQRRLPRDPFKFPDNLLSLADEVIE